ncbi:Uma2 family endonuclease [cf. Phormidesmis sp. LEGE 11477]|uniref:Uma2 family endonuclease n=1 Tax=cf. Phormidesmis sp. LEGE 11477 TaxID=1828680 RepID=UPI00187FF6BD|nr:Uma2 family endonuclease [cf. Phormidesmis sp. LEGE 11477]MBE9063859.1 Uma2 family endonuclease [cf. Phormidesmis sp. LEGE 11477]
MVQSKLKTDLPSGSELPDSDDIPVDNEDQNLLPNILLFVLNTLWEHRQDWFFAVDMGVYHTAGKNPRVPVVPDAFLSIGVPRHREGESFRRSYVVWEENDVVPLMTLELVSWSPGGEYVKKMEIYRNLGVLYYIIYNPLYWQRDRHQPFEVYKLVSGEYQLQIGEPFWMEEAGLALGRYRGTFGGEDRELLGWFDQNGDRILTSEEKAERSASQAERLAARLRELGEDPNLV